MTLAPALALCATLLIVSAVTRSLGGPSLPALGGYLEAAALSGVICLLLCVMGNVAKSAVEKRGQPLAFAWAELKPRLPLFAWCMFAWPIFLGATTTIKSAIPVIVGYHLDSALTDLDAALFGADPWRFAHAIVGPFGHEMMLLYHPVWGGLLAYSVGLASAFAPPKKAAILIISMAATLVFGGCILAYALSSTGPVLAHLISPELGERFAPLREAISDDVIAIYVANYLEAQMNNPQAVRAGGISAMPSMHLAICMLYVLFCRGTRLFWPAVVYGLVVFVGSIYSGLHYATDGPAGALVAIPCWYVSRWWVYKGSDVSRYSLVRGGGTGGVARPS